MNKTIGVIFSAVVGGLILFGAQQGWAAWQEHGRQLIDFNTVSNQITLTKGEINEIQKVATDTLPGVNFVVITVTNTGSADISERSFSAPTASLVRFDTIETPNNNPKNASLTTDGKMLTVKYRYLPAGAKHTFWVARQDFGFTDLKFAPDAPGVQLTTSPDPFRDDGFPWGWAFTIVGALVVFLIGLAVGEASAAQKLAAAKPEATGNGSAD